MEPRSTPLFRKVAIESAAGTQIGTALNVHWRGVKIFAAIACLLVMVLAALAVTVEYAPIYRIPSYVDTSGGLIRLTAPSSGNIVRIRAIEGGVVRQGELLVVLGKDVLQADGSSQHDGLQGRLTAERHLVESEIAAATQEAAAALLLIERNVAGLTAERLARRAELEANERLLHSLRKQRARMVALKSQGYVTNMQLEEQSDDVTLQESHVAAARAALIRIDSELDSAQARRSELAARKLASVERLRREESELSRLAVQNQAQSEQAVRAPADGVISRSLVAQGQSVARGQALFTIAPANQPLIIRMLVPARAAAVVQLSSRIKVTLFAYPQEKFGDFPAQIVSVSDSALLPNDAAHLFPITEPSFIAVASLPSKLRGPDGQALKLKPGMLAEALVPVERRTIAEWLFAPILRGLSQGGGEINPAAWHAVT